MIRVAMVAISERILAGRVGRDGFNFIGNPTDVTSDVLKSVIEKCGVGKSMMVHINGKPGYEIFVRPATETTSSATAVGRSTPLG